MKIWLILNHCSNESKSEYCIRLQTHDFKEVLIGQDALNKLEEIFSVPYSPKAKFYEND